jgi:hypothetical protein
MMYFLLHFRNEYKIYHSLRRLCKENGLDPDKVKRDHLPCQTSAGYIVAVVPDTRA